MNIYADSHSPTDIHRERGIHRHLLAHHRGAGECCTRFIRKIITNSDGAWPCCNAGGDADGVFMHRAQISKPSNPGRLGKGGREQDSHAAHSDQLLSAVHSVNRNTRKLSGQVRTPKRSFCDSFCLPPRLCSPVLSRQEPSHCL